MARYSYAQLVALWSQAGGRSSAGDVAAAVALAESRGDPNAYNASDPHGGSRGLWQINGQHGELSTFDPLGNARAAVQISRNGADWSPWSTYTHGTYRTYLRGSSAPVNGSADAAIAFARAAIGTPYQLGSIGPARYDCSGLVLAAYKAAGAAGAIGSRRLSWQQYDYLKAAGHVSSSGAQPGDLVFYASRGARVSHVGLYIGNGRVISALTSGVTDTTVTAVTVPFLAYGHTGLSSSTGQLLTYGTQAVAGPDVTVWFGDWFRWVIGPAGYSAPGQAFAGMSAESKITTGMAHAWAVDLYEHAGTQNSGPSSRIYLLGPGGAVFGGLEAIGAFLGLGNRAISGADGTRFVQMLDAAAAQYVGQAIAQLPATLTITGLPQPTDSSIPGQAQQAIADALAGFATWVPEALRQVTMLLALLGLVLLGLYLAVKQNA